LTAGQDYLIGALQSSDIFVCTTASIVTAPQITYLEDAYTDTGVLSAPYYTYPPQEAGYFGPNFRFTSDGAVPDGSTTMLLLGMGLAGLAFVKCRIS
jgi:hypothetical protein